EPVFAEDVPGGRQDDDASVVKGGEVVLDAAVAQGVLDAVLLRLAGEVRLGDEVGAVLDTEFVDEAAQGDGAAGEIAGDAGCGGGLDHLAVAGGGPGVDD